MSGTLSIVATPIGNLEDITLRALRILKEVDYILAEDTRVTGKLLKHYGIKTKVKRYDAHASEKVHETIIEDLKTGKHVALVSDAGTPGISDPGVFLVSRIREANAGTIEAIPGPSAITAAFSVAGIRGNEFFFLGFVPQKKGRESFFTSLETYTTPVVFYESPHRIMKTLTSLRDSLPEDRTVVISRELTKLHEETISGTAGYVLEYFETHPDHIRGEFVVLIAGR